jgi:hypothetical protein
MLVYLPYDVQGVECNASLTARYMEEHTAFTFSVSKECPDIYGFYLTPTNNDHIMINNSPEGWSGGGDKHNFLIWLTRNEPVQAGTASGEFIVTLIGPDSHELNWSIADENLMPIYWDRIVIENSS